MSHDPRYVSSAPRPAASGAADQTRPRAGFYRARMVEIKRRGPASRVSASPDEQQPRMVSPRYRASPAVQGEETSGMTPSPRREGEMLPSQQGHYHDVPPPPPPHSPSQKSLSITRGSYMDYESNGSSSRSPHFSQPFRQSPPPPPPRHQHQQDYDSRASPAAAIRAARATRAFRYETEEEPVPHQSTPPQPPPHAREEYDPRRLLPTAVRPSQAFQFELEEEPAQLPSSEPHVPGRFPSSPDAMEVTDTTANSPMGGVQEEHISKLRPKAGSYRELQPYELGLIYSNPAPYQTPTPSTESTQQNRSDPSEPFIYEIRSPRKANHDGSNKPLRQSVYNARNPAHEAETFPLLRQLGADQRYATSFRAEPSGIVGQRGAVERGEVEEQGEEVERGGEVPQGRIPCRWME